MLLYAELLGGVMVLSVSFAALVLVRAVKP